MNTPVIYKFGPFRIDTGDRLLIREGQVIPLPPKAVDTLIALIGAGGRVLEKEELGRMVWPDTNVEVDNALARNVNQLRKALGDGPENSQYIETIPKRGYRWVAPVEEPAREPPIPPIPPVPWWKYKAVFAVVPLVVGLGVFSTWAYLHFRAPSFRSIMVRPLADLS